MAQVNQHPNLKNIFRMLVWNNETKSYQFIDIDIFDMVDMFNDICFELEKMNTLDSQFKHAKSLNKEKLKRWKATNKGQ